MARSARIIIYLLAISAVLLALVWRTLQLPAPMALPQQGFTLASVVLVVPGSGRSAPLDLVVANGRIQSATPAQGSLINGYVLPGLTDAHIHGPMLAFPGEEALYAFLFLYHGITHVRMAAGDDQLRAAIDAGEYPGPMVHSCGPFVDGEQPQWPSSLVVTDEASAQAAVASIAEQGYNCVKVYNDLAGPASKAVYNAASQRGLPTIGHLPQQQDVPDAWIDDLQHLSWLPAPHNDNIPYAKAMLRIAHLTPQRIQDLTRALVERDIAITPTLVTLQRKAALQNSQQMSNTPTASLLPDYYRKHLWHGKRGLVSSRLFSPADHDTAHQAYPIALQALAAFHSAGVRIHSGTDTPAEFIVPGAGLIEELQLLSEAGLSPEEVLYITTIASKRDIFGTAQTDLTVGSPANFVVYQRDPTQSLQYLDSRQAVVREGRLYTRAALDEQLARYQAGFQSRTYRWVSNTIVRALLWLISFADTK